MTEFKVLYRTGGTENFQWRVIFTCFRHIEEADEKFDELRRMGYKALLVTWDEWENIGLPITYNADEYFPPEAANG